MTKTLAARIKRWLSRSKDSAFVRKEFGRFGEPGQVGRALRELVNAGRLVKIGYGVYAKARLSSQTGNPIPCATLFQLGLQFCSESKPSRAIG